MWKKKLTLHLKSYSVTTTDREYTAPTEMKSPLVLEHCFITGTVGIHVVVVLVRELKFIDMLVHSFKEVFPYIHSYTFSISCNSKICKQTWIVFP